MGMVGSEFKLRRHLKTHNSNMRDQSAEAHERGTKLTGRGRLVANVIFNCGGAVRIHCRGIYHAMDDRPMVDAGDTGCLW
jgi:hypothetical protein